MMISQNKFEILLDGVFLGKGRAASAYMPISGLLAIGALAFLVLTHERAAVDRGGPPVVQATGADIDLATAGRDEDDDAGWASAIRRSPGTKPLVKPTQILLRGAFQGVR